MKAIFSFKENRNAEFNLYEHKKLLHLANFCAQKQGFETIFWGDEYSLKNFKEINFNHTEKFPEQIFNNFPKCFWSAAKLISLSLINEPCVHIDNDLFLLKPIQEDFFKNEIFCFHKESFTSKWHNRLQDLFIIKPKEVINIQIDCYNCGLLGGQDIKTIKKSINMLFNFISDNANYLDNIYYLNKDRKDLYVCPSVLFEQIWMFQIFKFFKKEIYCLLPMIHSWDHLFKKFSEIGITHLMRGKKKFFKKYNEMRDAVIETAT